MMIFLVHTERAWRCSPHPYSPFRHCCFVFSVSLLQAGCEVDCDDRRHHAEHRATRDIPGRCWHPPHGEKKKKRTIINRRKGCCVHTRLAQPTFPTGEGKIQDTLSSTTLFSQQEKKSFPRAACWSFWTGVKGSILLSRYAKKNIFNEDYK